MEEIEVSCDKAENSPVIFDEEDFKILQNNKNIIKDIKDTEYDEKKLIIYFEKVREIIKYSPLKYGTKNFEIKLKAKILPNINLPKYVKKQIKWKVTKWPRENTGKFNNNNDIVVKYINPKKGGLYKFEIELWKNGTKGYAVVLLRLAGPEIKDWVKKELQLIDKYSLLVRNKHKDKYPLGIYSATMMLHTYEICAVADWTGQAKGEYSPIRDLKLNAQYTTHTLCGVPIDNKKLSNILVAYLVKSINPSLISEYSKAFFGWKGTPGKHDDEYADASYSAGFELYYGRSLEYVMEKWGYYMQPPSGKSTHASREWPSSEKISNKNNLRSYTTELINRINKK